MIVVANKRLVDEDLDEFWMVWIDLCWVLEMNLEPTLLAFISLDLSILVLGIRMMSSENLFWQWIQVFIQFCNIQNFEMEVKLQF